MDKRIERYLLRVDLSTETVRRETIPETDIAMFLGGRALGDIYLYRELAPGIEPLAPENKLIFGVGPLTGTSAPGNGRYIIHCKSPQTGLWNGSLAGGHFGPELRKSGYDMLIIEGKAEKPVYLLISNEGARIKDAGFLWGMDTFDTQQLIKEELRDQDYRIACIGPAGENMVCYAGVVSERRIAGRGGCGAVMGSKNLKAIAVRGTNEVRIADQNAFKNALKLASSDLSSNPDMVKGFAVYGSAMAMPTMNEAGITPWRNWQQGCSDKAVNLFIQTWREKYVKKDVLCHSPCPMICSKLVVAEQGPYAGVLTEGPDYETLYSFGANCDIDDPTAIFAVDSLCDKLGLDSISAGLSISFAMECFEKGIIKPDETGGVDIEFGCSDLLPKLIHDIAYRRGIGYFLSMGTKKMSEELGHGSESFAMHCKGMEIGGYDPRAAKSVALVYAAGARGGCHKAGGGSNSQSLGEYLTGDKRFLNEGKAKICFDVRKKKIIVDSGVLCSFTAGAYKMSTIMELLNASTGYDWSEDELYLISERGNHIERAFNVREGLRKSWDVLPDRLTKESVAFGPTAGSTVEFEELLDDFYRLSNWDLETGIPIPDRLRELGLAEIAADMERY